MRNKKNEQKLISEIRIILFYDWDPIGANYNKLLMDEYDHYIPEVIELLKRNASIEEIVNYLEYVENIKMNVKTDNITRYKVASNLKALYSTF